jgi:acyl carrier protein
MEANTLNHQLTTIFRKIFNDETIVVTEEMTADDIGSWNSLSHMLMIAEVENCFSIKFSLREINKLKNVGELIRLIQSKMKNIDYP